MFTAGFVIILGLTFIFVKLKRSTMLWLLGHHLAIDVGVTIVMTIVHWGTFTGLMAAAVAGLMCSCFTTAARYLVGYTEKGKFVPGKLSQ